jgi:hypothetical protein
MTEQIAPFGGTGEVVQRLQAYAIARLSPTPAASARMRARVLREAALVRQSADAPVAPSAVVVPLVARRRTRRLTTALLAAALTVLTLAGGALAAQPGGPLYGTRMMVEAAFLPADPGRRVESDISRLEDRLAEASHAASAGNSDAVMAALDAYRSITADALATAGENVPLQTRLELVLGKHLAVLEALEATVPDTAADALERAIENSGKAIDRVRPGPPSGGPRDPGQGNQGNQGGQGDPKPGATKAPAVAPTPSPTRARPTSRPTTPPGGSGSDQGQQGNGSDR